KHFAADPPFELVDAARGRLRNHDVGWSQRDANRAAEIAGSGLDEADLALDPAGRADRALEPVHSPEEIGDRRGRWRAIKLVRRRDLKDFSSAHDGHAVRKRRRFG